MGGCLLPRALPRMDKYQGTSTLLTQLKRSEKEQHKETCMNEYLLGISPHTYFATYQEKVT